MATRGSDAVLSPKAKCGFGVVLLLIACYMIWDGYKSRTKSAPWPSIGSPW